MWQVLSNIKTVMKWTSCIVAVVFAWFILLWNLLHFACWTSLLMVNFAYDDCRDWNHDCKIKEKERMSGEGLKAGKQEEEKYNYLFRIMPMNCIQYVFILVKKKCLWVPVSVCGLMAWSKSNYFPQDSTSRCQFILAIGSLMCCCCRVTAIQCVTMINDSGHGFGDGGL